MKTEAGNIDETETDQTETQATVIEEVEEAEVAARRGIIA